MNKKSHMQNVHLLFFLVSIMASDIVYYVSSSVFKSGSDDR